MTTLIYVRHGQSMANLLMLYAGQKDFELSESGRKQATRIADFLKTRYPISRIYASDLCRAMDTARPTAEAFSLDVIPLEDLRERKVGIWEGLSGKEIMEVDADFRFALERNDAVAFVPKGAENMEQVFLRAKRAEDRILAENRGGCVAVFSHFCVIKLLANNWKKSIPEVDPYVENASITVVNFDDNGIVQGVPLSNYQNHLGEDATVSL